MSFKKRIIVFSVLALIITVSYILWNLDDFYRIKGEKLYSATSVSIINTKGESVTLDSVETQELVDSMGSLPLTKANDRIKTPFTNKISFILRIGLFTKLVLECLACLIRIHRW